MAFGVADASGLEVCGFPFRLDEIPRSRLGERSELGGRGLPRPRRIQHKAVEDSTRIQGFGDPRVWG